MMTHDDYRKQLPDYALNLLSPEQLGVIEHHIATLHLLQARLAARKEVWPTGTKHY